MKGFKDWECCKRIRLEQQKNFGGILVSRIFRIRRGREGNKQRDWRVMFFIGGGYKTSAKK